MNSIHIKREILLALTVLSGVVLSSNVAMADNDSVVDEINITVPVSCTLSGTGMDTHNATINNGQYNSAVGETTMKAFCNDNNGFAIYAIGYTDNLNGKNVLTNSELGDTFDIPTGTLITGANSQWAMKLSTVSSPVPTYPIIVAGSADDAEKEQGDQDFTSFQEVPDDYTLVAKRASGTDIGTSAEGSTLKTTYQTYISPTQAAGTYTGQVKYTLVHPNDANKPASSTLLTGEEVNAKMKTLAAGTEKAYSVQTSDIKAIRMASELPANFEASEANTVSTPDSKYPVYIFFDNTNNAGIMYFFTEGETVTMNPDSGNLFLRNKALADISGLSNWDASYVESLRFAFREVALTSLHGLEDWDTSSLTDLTQAFNRNTSLNTISALANWSIGKVTNMTNVFGYDSALTSLHGLEDWDTHSVVSLDNAFWQMTSLTSLSALSNWNTGNVTSMISTFAYDSSLTTLSGLENWNTSRVTTLEYTFSKTTNLIDISALANWKTSRVESMSYLLSYATNLTSLHGLEEWDVKNVVTLQAAFIGDASLINVYALADWDTRSLTNLWDTFAYDNSLASLHGLENWDVSRLTTLRTTFAATSSLTEISALANWNTSNVTDMYGTFSSAINLTSAIPLSRWNTSSVTSMEYMFYRDKALTTIDVSNWDTNNVTNMQSMFNVGDNYEGNGQLADIIGLGNLSTSNVTDMTTMFYGAGQMTSYDIAGWNVSKVESFNHMFCDNFKLESLDLSKWDVSSAKTMYNMFDDNYKLTTIGDVSHWNTGSLIDIGGWLNGASSFVGNNGTLDLSGWNTSNLKSSGEVFRATKLQTIDLSGWTFSSITNSAWEGAGSGIYYAYGNEGTTYRGLGGMFKNASLLNTVYVSQSGLNSFNTVVNNGVNTLDMWTGSSASGFTIKQ